MPVLTAVGEELDPLEPEGPVGAERPVRLTGPESEPLVAGPVRPELLELDPAAVGPDPPEVATGMADRIDVPPEPPALEADPTLEPPVAVTRPLGDRRTSRLTTGAPAPERSGRASPPGPPWPPTEAAVVLLAASPVSPERATALEPAPLLAEESAAPAAIAAPVEPDPPVLPVRTGPPTTVAEPRIAELVAVGAEVAPPVLPVGPELPDWARGWDAAADEAEPVSPVLVLPDWALEAPELPLVAVGLTVTVDPPPLPPLALPVATPLPPVPVTTSAPAGPAPRKRAPATRRAAIAAEEARLAAMDALDIAGVLESRVTFTSFTAMGKLESRADPNKAAERRRDPATTAGSSPAILSGLWRGAPQMRHGPALDSLDGWDAPDARAAVVGGGGAGVLETRGDAALRGDWASVTKLVTALAVLVAVEEEVVDLDEPAGPPGSTVRHLLSHASGLAFDEDRVMAEPGRRRIYSNVGFEELGRLVGDRAGMPFGVYLTEGVLAPLGMAGTTLDGSPASGLLGPLDDLVRLATELLDPSLVSQSTMRAATKVAFPNLSGVLPGFGRHDPLDWGLGFEIRDAKSPHWTGRHNSPATFGHFGASGSFLWVDPDAGLACAALSGRDFGQWAKKAWPATSDVVLARHRR
jgi:CubicO group peptidase (beta-lactamase class C family)